MAEMMKLAQPGPEHETLATYAGDWDYEVSMQAAPGGPPMTQKGTATAKTILGGRFLELEASGSFMGQPFESLTILGFDRRHEAWTTVGFDNHGTYWVSASGKSLENGTIRMHGQDDDPMGAQVYFFDVTFVDADTFTYDVYFESIGPQVYDEPFKMVAVRYTRK